MASSTSIIVAAIDFGTTYSGYAYSFRDEYNKDPLKIYANSDWNDGFGLITQKAPTVVLFDKDGKFDSFGYEAEKRYAELAEDDEDHGWRFFRRFKMELFKARLKRNKEIDDDQGRSMKAMVVFSAAIKYLKKHLMTRLHDRVTEIREEDIQWVLTVPAIWNDAAKQFMIEAAGEAGIPEDRLTLAYEPEAAAIYCNEVKINKAREKGVEVKLQTLKPGATFMVLDLGGGTVDVTVHQVRKDFLLDTLSPPSGGPWGGTCVDRKFLEFIEKLFGKDTMTEFTKQSKADKLDLDRMLEIKKRQITFVAEKEMLRLPQALYEIFKDVHETSFDKALKTSEFAEKVVKKRDKLQIDNEILLQMFEYSKTKIIDHVLSLLKNSELRNVKTVVMVGGLSESKVISDAVKQTLPNVKVVIPEQGGLAVLKGAVMYGQNTDSIKLRRMRYSYGISTAVRFDPSVHSPMHRVTSATGFEKCEDIFKAFVTKGDRILNDKVVTERFNPPDSGEVKVEIYRAESDNVLYVQDEGCKMIGTLDLKIPEGKPQIDVSMTFGGTRLGVHAKVHGASKGVLSHFDFMK